MGSFLTTRARTSPFVSMMIKLYLLSLSVLYVSGASFMDYLDYLPPSVKDFVEETIEKGTDVVDDITEDVQNEVISKTSGHFENMSEAEEKELSEKLKEIEQDMTEDEQISDDVEKMIQQHLNTFRASMLDMTKSWRGWHKNFYDSSELIVPATEILNNRAKEMKAEISELFKTFREIDISKIGAEEETDEDEGVPREIYSS